MTNHDEHQTNFFKPGSDHARANRNLIFTLAMIWAVAVFGFHFLLIVTVNPTPEETLGDFNSVWPQIVEEESPAIETKRTFSKTLLMVLGKNIAVKDDHKAVLKEGLTWAVTSMLADSVQHEFQSASNEQQVAYAATSIGLGQTGFDKIMKDLLPTSLVKLESPSLSANAKSVLPEIMELYLVHNQSFLTDFRFLGFPFHYWYTAQFLLILFVVLCLIYALTIEKINNKYQIVDET
jgi:putative solute:sodium symporter small subunit